MGESVRGTGAWGLDRVDDLNSRNGVYTYDFFGRDVFVYVLDSGVDAKHADFDVMGQDGSTTRVEPGYTTYPPSARGQAGTVDGWGHGTHVASVIGGLSFGIAKGVTIVPVRVLDASGSGSLEGLMLAVDWAIEDAKRRKSKRIIMNLSLDTAYNAEVDEKLRLAKEFGFVIVGAAGNRRVDACTRMPGGSPHVVSVGSTSSSVNPATVAPNDKKATAAQKKAAKLAAQEQPPFLDAISGFSDTGPCVTLLAPGSEIPGAKTNTPEGSLFMSGTSMASPHVAGVAALLWSKYPTWTNLEIIERLVKETVRDAVDLAKCGPTHPECARTTANRLVQVPIAESLTLDGQDVVFAPAPFGGNPSYWPRLRGNTQVFGTGCAAPETSSVEIFALTSPVAVLDFSNCFGVSAYDAAFRAAQAGALMVIVVSHECRGYDKKLWSLPAQLTQDRIDGVPVVCVSPSIESTVSRALLTSSVSLRAELGLVREFVAHGPKPWSLTLSSKTSVFREWRVDWSGLASGAVQRQDEGVCFRFDRNFEMKDAYTLLVALSSEQQIDLDHALSPSEPTLNRYVVALTTKTVQIHRNTATLRKSNLVGNPTHKYYVRLDKRESAVEMGYVESTFDKETGVFLETPMVLSRVVDPNLLFNIDFFSLTMASTASKPEELQIYNIQPCGEARLDHGTLKWISLGGAGGLEATPPPTWVKTDAPTTPAPTAAAFNCKKFKKKAGCTRKANKGKCGWTQKKKCFAKPNKK